MVSRTGSAPKGQTYFKISTGRPARRLAVERESARPAGLLVALKPLLGVEGRHAAEARGGHRLPIAEVVDVTGREDAVHGSGGRKTLVGPPGGITLFPPPFVTPGNPPPPLGRPQGQPPGLPGPRPHLL